MSKQFAFLMSDPDLPKKLPEILDCQLIAESRLLKIESLHLKFSNGVERQYERMKGSGRGAVMVVPITADNKFLLVREYAAGTHEYQLGFPKGLIDPGELPAQAANRELQEEVGFGANKLFQLKTMCMAPAFFSSSMTIFVATDLFANRLQGDEPEPLDVVYWPIEKADELLNRQDFNEARGVAALFLAKDWIRDNSEELG